MKREGPGAKGTQERAMGPSKGFLCYGYYCRPFAMASFSASSMALSYADMSSTALSSSDSLGAVAATMRPSFCCLDGFFAQARRRLLQL